MVVCKIVCNRIASIEVWVWKKPMNKRVLPDSTLLIRMKCYKLCHLSNVFTIEMSCLPLTYNIRHSPNLSRCCVLVFLMILFGSLHSRNNCGLPLKIRLCLSSYWYSTCFKICRTAGQLNGYGNGCTKSDPRGTWICQRSWRSWRPSITADYKILEREPYCCERLHITRICGNSACTLPLLTSQALLGLSLRPPGCSQPLGGGPDLFQGIGGPLRRLRVAPRHIGGLGTGLSPAPPRWKAPIGFFPRRRHRFCG